MCEVLICFYLQWSSMNWTYTKMKPQRDIQFNKHKIQTRNFNLRKMKPRMNSRLDHAHYLFEAGPPLTPHTYGPPLTTPPSLQKHKTCSVLRLYPQWPPAASQSQHSVKLGHTRENPSFTTKFTSCSLLRLAFTRLVCSIGKPAWEQEEGKDSFPLSAPSRT